MDFALRVDLRTFLDKNFWYMTLPRSMPNCLPREIIQVPHFFWRNNLSRIFLGGAFVDERR